MSDPPPVRRARHLLDPDNPRPRPQPTRGAMSLDTVQKWVLSTLACFTIMHLAIFAAGTAYFVEDDRLDARIGLNVMAALIGVVAMVAARLIHRANPLSWWLLVGLVPGVVGAYFTFWF